MSPLRKSRSFVSPLSPDARGALVRTRASEHKKAMLLRNHLQPLFILLALSYAMCAPVAAHAATNPSPGPTAAPTAPGSLPQRVNDSSAASTTARTPTAYDLLTSARADADRGQNQAAAEKLHRAAAMEPRNADIQK